MQMETPSVTETTRKSLLENPWHKPGESIKVIARIRPTVNRGEASCVQYGGRQHLTVLEAGSTTSLSFDFVASHSLSQTSFFKVAGVPMADHTLAFYNTSILAFGQTGSGKTYTMLGDIPHDGSMPKDAGLVPRIIQYIFQKVAGQQDMHQQGGPNHWLVRLSMLEIYNEAITDLLQPSGGKLQIRESIKDGPYVQGLSETVVQTGAAAFELIHRGVKNRAVASTCLNTRSSRSHCILTCHIERREDHAGITTINKSRLHMVDLAGSERNKDTGSVGQRQKEACSINQSLSNLELVIKRILEPNTGPVPYRDSKLTHLLKDALGGNSRTLLVANINPSMSCQAQTFNTLRFAIRAKEVKNQAFVNEETIGNVVPLQQEIARLRTEMGILRKQQKASMFLQPSQPAEVGLAHPLVKAQRVYQDLEDSLTDSMAENAQLKGEAKRLSRECSTLQYQVQVLQASLIQCEAELQVLHHPLADSQAIQQHTTKVTCEATQQTSPLHQQGADKMSSPAKHYQMCGRSAALPCAPHYHTHVAEPWQTAEHGSSLQQPPTEASLPAGAGEDAKAPHPTPSRTRHIHGSPAFSTPPSGHPDSSSHRPVCVTASRLALHAASLRLKHGAADAFGTALGEEPSFRDLLGSKALTSLSDHNTLDSSQSSMCHQPHFQEGDIACASVSQPSGHTAAVGKSRTALHLAQSKSGLPQSNIRHTSVTNTDSSLCNLASATAGGSQHNVAARAQGSPPSVVQLLSPASACLRTPHRYRPSTSSPWSNVQQSTPATQHTSQSQPVNSQCSSVNPGLASALYHCMNSSSSPQALQSSASAQHTPHHAIVAARTCSSSVAARTRGAVGLPVSWHPRIPQETDPLDDQENAFKSGLPAQHHSTSRSRPHQVRGTLSASTHTPSNAQVHPPCKQSLSAASTPGPASVSSAVKQPEPTTPYDHTYTVMSAVDSSCHSQTRTGLLRCELSGLRREMRMQEHVIAGGEQLAEELQYRLKVEAELKGTVAVLSQANHELQLQLDAAMSHSDDLHDDVQGLQQSNEVLSNGMLRLYQQLRAIQKNLTSAMHPNEHCGSTLLQSLDLAGSASLSLSSLQRLVEALEADVKGCVAERLHLQTSLASAQQESHPLGRAVLDCDGLNTTEHTQSRAAYQQQIDVRDRQLGDAQRQLSDLWLRCQSLHQQLQDTQRQYSQCLAGAHMQEQQHNMQLVNLIALHQQQTAAHLSKIRDLEMQLVHRGDIITQIDGQAKSAQLEVAQLKAQIADLNLTTKGRKTIQPAPQASAPKWPAQQQQQLHQRPAKDLPGACRGSQPKPPVAVSKSRHAAVSVAPDIYRHAAQYQSKGTWVQRFLKSKDTAKVMLLASPCKRQTTRSKCTESGLKAVVTRKLVLDR